MDEKAEGVCELVIAELDGHQPRLPANKTPTHLLLHLSLNFLVSAIPASGVLEREAHLMCPQSTYTARLEGVAQLVVIRQANGACSCQQQFAPSLGPPLLDKIFELICSSNMAEGVASIGL
jgi:hypothetical protein